MQQYDVSLLEKNDVYKIKHGRVLLDSIIVSGEVQAIQSANTGCDDVITLRKGERLESGSKVEDVHNDALAIVENVLENSILI